ncbi:MAG: ribonuclease HI family protein [Candidatus Dojkabacteria bacterium]
MYTLFTDGGSRGNPGNSACAYYIFKDDALEDFGGIFLGTGTNNNAEYLGLINGLKLAIKNNIKELEVRMDSELAIKQIIGVYKVSTDSIRELHHEVKMLEKNFKNVSFKHVPRAENKFADKLVNIILDTEENGSK